MLSRVAQSLYWMSRYLERAENTARLVDVNLQLMLDFRTPDVSSVANHWLPIVESTGDRERFLSRYPDASGRSVVDFLVFDVGNPNSIVEVVSHARENARTVRDQLTAELWEEINRLFLFLRSPEARVRFESSPTDFFSEIKNASLLLNEDFPRSLRFCVEELDAALRRLSGMPARRFANAAEQHSGRFLAELRFATIEDLLGEFGLHGYLDRAQGSLATIADAVYQAYVSQPQLVRDEGPPVEQQMQQQQGRSASRP